MDGGEARELTLNAFDTNPHSLKLGSQPWPKIFASIFDEQGKTTWFDLPPIPVNGEPIEIGLVDVVTYPFLFGMIRQIKDTPDLLWEINHNILAPFVDGLTGWAGVWSSFHYNEEPIDDAPAHNLVSFAARLPPEVRRREAERLFARIPAPATIAVTSNQPIMDSRCSLLQRRPQDAPARPLKIMRANEVVPQMLRRTQ